ncbi:hypothetical protein, partial [Paenibacillus eucommiae]
GKVRSSDRNSLGAYSTHVRFDAGGAGKVKRGFRPPMNSSSLLYDGKYKFLVGALECWIFLIDVVKLYSGKGLQETEACWLSI